MKLKANIRPALDQYDHDPTIKLNIYMDGDVVGEVESIIDGVVEMNITDSQGIDKINKIMASDTPMTFGCRGFEIVRSPMSKSSYNASGE